jgi:hypothetical protein
MTRALAVAALLVASTSVASAGTYLGLGIGTAPAVNSDVPASVEARGRSGRILGGWSFNGFKLGRLSIEGNAGRNDVYISNVQYASTMLSIGGKFNYPLGFNFEVFGRGGLQHTWLTTDRTDRNQADGNGLFVGAGFEYRLNVVATACSLFVDYQFASTGFEDDDMDTWDSSERVWTLGLTVSL